MPVAKNFFLHYDFRAPSMGPPAGDLYAAALEQCAWGETVGFDEESLELIASRVLPVFRGGSVPGRGMS